MCFPHLVTAMLGKPCVQTHIACWLEQVDAGTVAGGGHGDHITCVHEPVLWGKVRIHMFMKVEIQELRETYRIN